MATMIQRLAMLGPSPESHDDAASALQAYLNHGLLQRWPVDYIAAQGARSLGRFGALLARERKLAVHLHASPERGLGPALAFLAPARAAQCPYILHLHGTALRPSCESGGALARFSLRVALEQAAWVVVACESMRTWVRQVARNANVACLPYPVAPLPTEESARQRNLVLYLGKLEASKGLFELVEAVSRLRAAVPDVRLLFAGDGEREPLVRYAERLGAADLVRFTGWVGPSGKQALLEAATVFALPSYDEGLPLGVLEAMAAGVPVVVSPLGGVREVVADGVSGYFAAPGDVATLERHLRSVLVDRALAARMGAAARESIRVRCAPERALARLGALYAGLGLQPLGADAALHDPRSPTAAA